MWPALSMVGNRTCTQALWWFVCHFDAILQDTDGEDWAGVAGEPQPEVVVAVPLSQKRLAQQLQRWHEALGKVTIL